MRRDYTANAGWETFLSYEDVRQDILIGLLRLRRLPGRRSIVRELHVYGSAVAVHARDTSKHQHQARCQAVSLCVSLGQPPSAVVTVHLRRMMQSLQKQNSQSGLNILESVVPRIGWPLPVCRRKICSTVGQ